MKARILFLASALLCGTAIATSAQHGDSAKAHADAAPAAADAESDAQVVAAQLPSYPLTTCPISGEGLTEMGEPVDLVLEGRLVRLCCKGCVSKAKADAAAVFAKIDAAVVEAQKASYPLETCLVSGEKLGSMGEPLDIVHGTRLVRLCCKGCVRGFKKEPAKYIAQVDEALIAAQRETYPLDTCVIGGGELGSMGEPVDYLYGTQLVRFCCAKCKDKFLAEPEKALAKIHEAAKKGG